MTENTENTPQGFDLAGFISKATRPTNVVTVYGDGDAIGQMRKLEAEIDQEKYLPKAVREQRPAGKKSLQAQYLELWEKVQESSVGIWLRGHTEEESAEIIGDRKTAMRKVDHVRDEVNLDLIADAMITDGDAATPDMLRQLRSAIGYRQWKEIEHAYSIACHGVVTPDADFLQKLSTQDDGQE